MVFLAAVLTDALDGFLARLLHQQSKLGAFLDPLADKLLAGAALIMLFIEHEAPLWMVLLVAFRDGAQALGAVVVKRKGLERAGGAVAGGQVRDVRPGLLRRARAHRRDVHRLARAPRLPLVAGYFTGLCVAISTAQYFLRWGHLWVAPARRVP